MLVKKLTTDPNGIRINSMSEIVKDKVCFWKHPEHGWYFYMPVCGVCSIAKHSITEHDDGTITASPSILVTTKNFEEEFQVHGYLEKGKWRDC